MSRASGGHDLVAQLLTDPVDRHKRVRALVDIGSNNNMEVASFTVR
jgi:hypothetical protein